MPKAPTVYQEFVVVDKATGKLKVIRKEEEKTGKAMKGVSKQANTLSKSIKGLGLAFGGLVVAQKSAKFLGDSIKEYAKLEHQLTKTRAVSGATAKEMQQLEKQARSLGETTANSAIGIAGLQYELSKLGFVTDEIIGMTEAVGDLSIALDHDLSDSATIVGTTMRQFGLEAEESTRIVDLIGKSATSSAVDITSYSEAMKFAGLGASSMGLSVEEASASISALADVGLKGSLAGTNLNRAFMKLQSTSGKAGKLMKKFTGDTTDLNEVLEFLSDNGMADAKNATQVFDIQAGRAIATLVKHRDKVKDLNTSYENASGTIEGMTDLMSDTLIGRTKSLSSAFSEFKTTIGESFKPLALEVINELTASVKEMKWLYETITGKTLNDHIDKQSAMRHEWMNSAKSIKKVKEHLREANQAFKETKTPKGFGEMWENFTGKGATARLDKARENIKAITGSLVNIKLDKSTGEFLVDGMSDLAIDRLQTARMATGDIKKNVESTVKTVKKAVGTGGEDEGGDYKPEKEAKIIDLIKVKTDALKVQELTYNDLVRARKKISDDELKAKQEELDKFKETESNKMDWTRKYNAEKKELSEAWRDTSISVAQEVVNATASIMQMGLNREKQEINDRMQSEIDAVNNRDKKMTSAEKRRAKEILAIKKKYGQEEHKIKEAEWGVQGAQIASSGALAVTKALATGGPLAIPLSVATGAVVAGQLAVWGANKPQPPKFASGGVVGGYNGASMGVDNTTAVVREGEMILNGKQQEQLFRMANGTTNNVSMGGVNINIDGSVNPEATALAVQEVLEDAQRRGMSLV